MGIYIYLWIYFYNTYQVILCLLLQYEVRAKIAEKAQAGQLQAISGTKKGTHIH